MSRYQAKYVVNGVTAATLRVLAMCTPASLHYEQLSGDVYRVSVPLNIIFIICAFLMFALRAVNIYLFLNVLNDENIPNFGGISNLGSFLVTSWPMCYGLIITTFAIVRARKQMLRQIHFLYTLQKILCRFDLGSSLDSVLRKIKIYFFCCLLFLVTSCTIDVYLSDEDWLYVKHGIYYITFFLNDVVIIMVGMQYFVIISIIHFTIKNIYRFLLQHINHEDKRGYKIRPHREIRTFAGDFLSVCAMVQTINSDESVLLLMILLSEISDIAWHIYYLVSAIQLPVTYTRTKEIALQMMWLIYVTTRMFYRIESGHLLNNELPKVKDILCSILHKLSHNSYHTEELNSLFEQVLLLQSRFAPLDIITFNRKLKASIVSALITYLIILLQFQLRDTYSLE